MRKLLYILIIFQLGVLSVFAQQTPMHSLYNFNRYMINPAYAGGEDAIVGVLDSRKQFIGILGAPSTNVLSVHAPWYSKNVGLGLKVISDKHGSFSETTVLTSYSYAIILGPGKLSFAIEAGIFNESVKFSELKLYHITDDIVLEGDRSKIFPDASFGLYYLTDNRNLFAGYSMFHLLNNSISINPVELERSAELRRHHYITVGGNHSFGEIKVEPSILMKNVYGASMQLDLSARAIYKDMVSLGGLYRTGDGMSFSLGVQKSGVIVAFGYDISTSNLSSYINNGWEVMLGYKKELIPPANKKQLHPRAKSFL